MHPGIAVVPRRINPNQNLGPVRHHPQLNPNSTSSQYGFVKPNENKKSLEEFLKSEGIEKFNPKLHEVDKHQGGASWGNFYKDVLKNGVHVYNYGEIICFNDINYFIPSEHIQEAQGYLKEYSKSHTLEERVVKIDLAKLNEDCKDPHTKYNKKPQIYFDLEQLFSPKIVHLGNKAKWNKNFLSGLETIAKLKGFKIEFVNSRVQQDLPRSKL